MPAIGIGISAVFTELAGVDQGPPANSYVVESGLQEYIVEDGSTFYKTEA